MSEQPLATRADVVLNGVPMMDEAEARAVVTRIQGRIEEARRDLLDLHDREGWRALGYTSWGACAKAEFGGSTATLYRQLEAAQIARDLGDSQIENLPTTQLQALKDVPLEQRRAVLEAADELAGDGARTAAHIRAAKPAPVDDGAPHLPADFQAAQARAKKIGLYISMNAGGRFTLTYETGVRAVAGTGLAWPAALDLLTTLEREKHAPPPAQGTFEEEIASAAPPVLTPRPTALPPMLTPLTPPASDDQALIQLAAMLLYCRKLVALAQREWDDIAKPHLDVGNVPVVQLDEAQAEAAARMALSGPAMRAQAGMLTFGATVRMESWDESSTEADEERVA